MRTITRLAFFVVFLVFFLFPTNAFANTTPYRSAGWVGTDVGRANPYIDLTNCQTADGSYCSHPNASGSMDLYFSSFGRLSDFGMTQGATINKVHFRVKGKNSVVQWIQIGLGRNKPLSYQCQSPFDLLQVYLGPADTTKELHAPFTSDNFLATCFTPAIIDSQNFTVALFFNGYNVNTWSADIDNFEIAFDYTPGPTPTPIPTATPTPTPVPSPTPAPFLDLPWDYQGKGLSFDEAALAINSYFDHEYPLQSRGLDLVEPLDARNSTVTFLKPQRQTIEKDGAWYSSHDGYDYGIRSGVSDGDPVYPAAPGAAEYKYDTAGGNTIFIDHHNGYQTRYYHLQNNSTIVRIPGVKVDVDRNTVIGKVGATGSHVNGPHIHIGVFYDKNYDKNSDHNFTDYEPMGATDPFGWEPYTQESERDPDPWEHYTFSYLGKERTGSKSYYLWKTKLQHLAETVTSSGGTYNTDGFSLSVDKDTFFEPTNLQMNYVPAQKASDSSWSIGPVVSITAQNLLGDAITVLTKPVHLIWYPFRDADIARFKPGSFYLYSSKDGDTWTKETQVDPFTPGNITAAASHFTYFAIMGERKDLQPPTTTALFSGDQGQRNWYRSDVTVSLSATDTADMDPSGVDYTLYKLDDSDWQTYTDPLTISSEGSHTLSFYSGDKDGNIEDIKTQTFMIDKTPPEATISYDLNKFDILVSGRDAQSQTSVNISNALLSTIYTISDQAGNTLALATDKISADKQTTLRINTMHYNSDPVILLDNNSFFTLAVTDAKNKVLQLDQHYSLENDKKIFTMYSSRDNTTKISTRTPGTNGYAQESRSGIVLLQLDTEKGKLKYSY